MPLEQNTVRFLDNFSAGTRGAASTEYFLEHGYAVIFLMRRFSLEPFSRHFSHATNCFLNFFDVDESGNGVKVQPEHDRELKNYLKLHHEALSR